MSFDWGKLLGGVVKVAAAGGAAYVGYKAVEHEIDKLLLMEPEAAGQQIIASVPHMNEDAWKGFQTVLSIKAQSSDYAQALLRLASYVRNAMQNVHQLLTEQQVGEAVDILTGMLYRQDPWGRAVYAYVLDLYSQSSGMTGMKAQAVYGRLSADNILPS
jgi:hypothetical protein